MKIAYHSDTDSLYIDLSNQLSVETREIAEGINLDFDASGAITGIDIDGASKKFDIGTITLDHFPRETRVLQNLG